MKGAPLLQSYDVSGDAKEHVVRGLINETQYIFSLVAINKAGKSSDSDSVKCTPTFTIGKASPAGIVGIPGIPPKITSVSGEPGKNSATIFWIQPSAYPPVTKYEVYNNSTNRIEKTIDITREDISSATITGLAHGTYTYYVKATNNRGTSLSSDTVDITPYDVPNKPTGISCESFDTAVKIKWIEPSNNGSDITSYKLYQEGGGGLFSSGKQSYDVSGVSREHIVNGLTNATEYTFYLRAINKAGYSTESNRVKCTPLNTLGDPTSALLKPDKITGVSGEARDKSAIIFWKPHSANPHITKYDVYNDSTNSIAKTINGKDASRVEIDSLTNGTTYTYYVTATNAMGMSVSSDNVTITPYGVPIFTTSTSDFSGTAHCTYVKLNWKPPSDNGSPIQNYTISMNAVSSLAGPLQEPTIVSSDFSYTYILGLKNDISYTFSIKAKNIKGFSEPATIILTPSYDVCDFSFMTDIETKTNENIKNKALNNAKGILELSDIELSFNTYDWRTILSNFSSITTHDPVNSNRKKDAFTSFYAPTLKTMRNAFIDGSYSSYLDFKDALSKASADLSNIVIPNIEASFNELHIDLCNSNLDLSNAQAKRNEILSGTLSYFSSTKNEDSIIKKANSDISSNKFKMINNRIQFYVADAIISAYTLIGQPMWHSYILKLKGNIVSISNERFKTLELAKVTATAPAATPPVITTKPPPGRLAKLFGAKGGSTTRKKTVTGNKSKTKKNKELKSKLKSELKSEIKSELKSEIKSELKSKTESKTKIRAISKTRKIMNKNKH
jgi:hypothetical protein